MIQTYARTRVSREPGTVTVRATGAKAQLVLTGEIDVSLNTELYDAVAELEALGRPIEVHTRDVTYVDSSLMALLANIAHRCDHPISLVDPPPLVRYLLQVAELDDVVEIVKRRPDPRPAIDQIEGRTLLRARVRCSCSACSIATAPA